jgi:hypothetical protein
MKIIKSALQSIREINRKYAKPEIEMTPFVRICLYGLRGYLLLLIGLMIYKFVIAAHAGKTMGGTTPAAIQRAATQPVAMQTAVSGTLRMQ